MPTGVWERGKGCINQFARTTFSENQMQSCQSTTTLRRVANGGRWRPASPHRRSALLTVTASWRLAVLDADKSLHSISTFGIFESNADCMWEFCRQHHVPSVIEVPRISPIATFSSQSIAGFTISSHLWH